MAHRPGHPAVGGVGTAAPLIRQIKAVSLLLLLLANFARRDHLAGIDRRSKRLRREVKDKARPRKARGKKKVPPRALVPGSLPCPGKVGRSPSANPEDEPDFSVIMAQKNAAATGKFRWQINTQPDRLILLII